MLPDDRKAWWASALEALLQTQVDSHFKIATPEDLKKPEPYSDTLFKDAAIQWLIETDQVSGGLFSAINVLADILVIL